MGLKAPGGATTAVKPTPTPAPPISLPAKPAATPSMALPDPAELARRVVEAKRRVAEATTKAAMSANPYIVSIEALPDRLIVVRLTTKFIASSDSRKEENRLRC